MKEKERINQTFIDMAEESREDIKKERGRKLYHVQRLLWLESNILTCVFHIRMLISSQLRNKSVGQYTRKGEPQEIRLMGGAEPAFRC